MRGQPPGLRIAPRRAGSWAKLASSRGCAARPSSGIRPAIGSPIGALLWQEDMMSGSLSRAPCARLLVLLGMMLMPFAANGQTPSTGPRQDVSLRLDWVPTWYHGVFYLALNRGYYSDAGLNMTIGQGRGSATTAQVVGSGAEIRAHGHVNDDARRGHRGAAGGDRRIDAAQPRGGRLAGLREHQGAEGCRGQALGLHRRELR